MGVSILSYNGGVQFGLVTDKSFVADPQASSTASSRIRKAVARRSVYRRAGIALETAALERNLFDATSGDDRRSRAQGRYWRNAGSSTRRRRKPAAAAR
jgi:hypothetical protein